MSWPEGWDRAGRAQRPDADHERTQVVPEYAADYDPEFIPAEEPPGRVRYRRPGWSWPRKVAVGLGILLALVVLGAAGMIFYVDSHLTRTAALADYAGRPPAGKGENWLVVGSDSRDGLTAQQRKKLRTGRAVGRRTDTIMLLHTGGAGATLVSLPRDSYVEIPSYTDSRGNRRSAQRNKLNASYSFGGAQLLARTVEGSTGVHLDHYMEIGFGGFVGMVDAVGGVDICLDKAIHDRDSGANLKAGCQTVNGPQALSFVRARHDLANQDLGRVQRQQKFLQALTKKIARPSVVLNPFELMGVTNASLDAVTVDQDTGSFDLMQLFWNMRELSGGNGVTTTVPVADPDFRPGGGIGSAVKWDRAGAEALFGALRTDSPVSKPAKSG